jgi:thioredoxin-dependent peroxiredoxin
MLKEGDTAPDFMVTDQDGNNVRLSDYHGRRVVLYFYPKDDTPGCTKEACSIRDSYALFKENNIKVFGVSLDSEKSHQKFISKFSLPFTLLSDVNHVVADKYGVYGEKKFMGKTYMGVSRVTFLIDEEGKIKKVFEKVNVDEHAGEILEAFGEG